MASRLLYEVGHVVPWCVGSKHDGHWQNDPRLALAHHWNEEPHGKAHRSPLLGKKGGTNCAADPDEHGEQHTRDVNSRVPRTGTLPGESDMHSTQERLRLHLHNVQTSSFCHHRVSDLMDCARQ